MGELVKKESELIADIDLNQIGIESEKALNIQSSFLPEFEKYKSYQGSYKEIIKKEITPEVEKEAKELKNRLVKVRTAINRVHTSEKAYYLAASKFIDALKRKLQEPGKLMEADLKEISEYSKRKEEERLSKLQSERESQLSAFVEDVEGRDLCSMEEDVWEAYLSMQKKKHEEKLEAERKEQERLAEEQRIKDLHNERKESILDLWSLATEEEKSSNFGETSESDWNKLFKDLKSRKKKQDDKLKKAKQEKEKLLKQQKQKDELRSNRNKKLGQARRFAEFEGDISDLTSEKFEEVLLIAQDAMNKNLEERRKAAELEEELMRKQEEQKRLEEAAKALKNKSESEQLSHWINTFSLGNPPIENEKAELIQEKFRLFIKWSKEQIK